MWNIELLLLAVIFVLLSGLVFFVAQAVARLGRDPIRERLAAISVDSGVPEGQWIGNGPLVDSLAEQIPLTAVDNGELEQELRRAGYYKPTARQEFLAIRNSLVILAVIVSGIIAVVIGPENQALALRFVIAGVMVAALLWAVPRVLLRMRANRRVDRIRRALPDALDMITMCLTGGLSLQDALEHVSREVYFAHPDLAVELVILRQQAAMTTLEHAFHQFARRIDAPEIVAMSALIAQGQRLGTDVVTAVREYADEMRVKRRQLADEQSGKAGVKLLFPLIFCLLPSVFIILAAPAILEVLEFFQGFESATDLVPPQ